MVSCDIRRPTTEMNGHNRDQISGCHVFGMIFDGQLPNEEDRKGGGKVFAQPAVRVKRRLSKKYIRPIFKEPGSKIPKKNNEKTDHNGQYATTRITRNREIEQRSNIVDRIFGEDRSRDYFSTIAEDEEQIIQSSYSASRLEHIVGKPVDRYELDDKDDSITLRTRLLPKIRAVRQQRRQSYTRNSDVYTGCDSSVVTVSDLDNLEAKTLLRKNDLSLLRNEINIIVSDSLDERDSKPSERLKNQNDQESEKLSPGRDITKEKSLTGEEEREGSTTIEILYLMALQAFGRMEESLECKML